MLKARVFQQPHCPLFKILAMCERLQARYNKQHINAD
jgi:hypothetical protein